MPASPGSACADRTTPAAADAAKVAELMTEADLTGADAHGIFRLPQYVRRIRGGGFNTKPRIVVTPGRALARTAGGLGVDQPARRARRG
jgi:L-2-hydroxycarboxylate dehydrogenase (NAD+)